MELKDLKNLVRNGERVIIIEDGNPTLVVLSFEEYGKYPGQQGNTSRVKNAEDNDVRPLPEEEEFTLDDLPLE